MGADADISLDELARLIKLLGMLGSAHDGEVLNAARLAVRWLAEHQTDWATLLTPEPEPGVSGVVAPPDLDALEQAHEADRAVAYRNGYQAGLAAMAAQVKAQANMASQRPTWNINAQAFAKTHPGHSFTTMAGTGLGSGVGAPHSPSGVQSGFNQGPAAQGPVAGSGASGRAGGPVYPAGTWQRVAADLLDRDAQGVPGVFRGSREQDFVASLLARGWGSLTQAQENWLRDIAGRSGMSW